MKNKDSAGSENKNFEPGEATGSESEALTDKSRARENEHIENFKDYDIFEGLDEKEKKRPKGIGFLILVIVTAIVIISAIEYTNAGYIGEIKRYAEDVFDKTTEFFIRDKESKNRVTAALGEDSLKKETNVIPFENAANAKYAAVNGDIVAAGANYIARFSSKGKTKWETATSIVKPILDTAGDYIVLAEDGGRGICLYYKDKLVYSIQTASPIFTVDVSPMGDVAAAVDKEFFKGGVEVYNKAGKQVFSWNSGAEYVVDAAISKSSRRIAVVLINTDSRVVSNVQFFDINKTQGYHTASFEDTAVFNADFIGNTIDITGDNCIAGLGIDGKTKWCFKFGEKQIHGYAMDSRGNKIINMEKDAVPALHVYAENGKILADLEVNETPDYVDIMGRSILYNENRNIYFGIPRSEKKFTASMDIKQLKIVNSSTCLVVYNNSVEFITQ